MAVVGRLVLSTGPRSLEIRPRTTRHWSPQKPSSTSHVRLLLFLSSVFHTHIHSHSQTRITVGLFQVLGTIAILAIDLRLYLEQGLFGFIFPGNASHMLLDQPAV